jgi:hypothetical protein
MNTHELTKSISAWIHDCNDKEQQKAYSARIMLLGMTETLRIASDSGMFSEEGKQELRREILPILEAVILRPLRIRSPYSLNHSDWKEYVVDLEEALGQPT